MLESSEIRHIFEFALLGASLSGPWVWGARAVAAGSVPFVAFGSVVAPGARMASPWPGGVGVVSGCVYIYIYIYVERERDSNGAPREAITRN